MAFKILLLNLQRLIEFIRACSYQYKIDKFKISKIQNVFQILSIIDY